jgi:hypothetical protein
MKIIISEQQLSLLKNNEIESDYLKFFCKKSGSDSIYCQLLELRNTEKNEEIVEKFNENFKNLINFFYSKGSYRYNKSIVRDILSEFLRYDKERIFSFIKLLSDFISQKKFSESKTKKVLSTLKNSKRSLTPEKLEDFLKNVRFMGYSEYEDSFIGNEFEAYKTKLVLSYKCNQDLEYKLYDLIQKVQIGEHEIDILISKLKNCLYSTMSTTKNLVKSDIRLKNNLYTLEDGEKVQIFKTNDIFEVKKFDYEIDSYLSEFFSIFKESKLSAVKSQVVPIYNKIINEIYLYINKSFPDFPQKVGESLAGIVFDDNIIVPSKYIEFYWSNKGQRGCDELRLSIRFRVKPEYTTIEGYHYELNNPILEKTTKQITKGDRQKITCS